MFNGSPKMRKKWERHSSIVTPNVWVTWCMKFVKKAKSQNKWVTMSNSASRCTWLLTSSKKDNRLMRHRRLRKVGYWMKEFSDHASDAQRKLKPKIPAIDPCARFNSVRIVIIPVIWWTLLKFSEVARTKIARSESRIPRFCCVLCREYCSYGGTVALFTGSTVAQHCSWWRYCSQVLFTQEFF